MTNLFLKAKHWQLFLIMIGIPIVFQFYTFSKIFRVKTSSETTSVNNGFSQVLSEEFIQFDWFPVIMIFFGLILFGWFWSMGIGLQHKVPIGIKMKVKKFKMFLLIPTLYILCLIFFFSGIFSGMFPNNPFYGKPIIAIILPLHLISIFGIFYSMYFVAKTIKTAELQRQVGFGDVVGEFFMLWFYFIGIWIIQPRINKLYEKK